MESVSVLICGCGGNTVSAKLVGFTSAALAADSIPPRTGRPLSDRPVRGSIVADFSSPKMRNHLLPQKLYLIEEPVEFEAEIEDQMLGTEILEFLDLGYRLVGTADNQLPLQV